MTPAEIIAQAYSIIDDPDGTIPPAEMTMHLEDVALDFSRRSRVMRDTAAIAYQANRPVVTLPEDCLEIVRATNASYGELRPITKAGLPHAFEADEAEAPDRYTRDLTGPEQLTLYPTPTTGGTLLLYYIKQHVIGGDLLVPARYHLSLVYGAAAKALARSSNPEDQEKMARFLSAYESGVAAASSEASSDFRAEPTSAPYRHL